MNILFVLRVTQLIFLIMIILLTLIIITFILNIIHNMINLLILSRSYSPALYFRTRATLLAYFGGRKYMEQWHPQYAPPHMRDRRASGETFKTM